MTIHEKFMTYNLERIHTVYILKIGALQVIQESQGRNWSNGVPPPHTPPPPQINPRKYSWPSIVSSA